VIVSWACIASAVGGWCWLAPSLKVGDDDVCEFWLLFINWVPVLSMMMAIFPSLSPAKIVDIITTAFCTEGSSKAIVLLALLVEENANKVSHRQRSEVWEPITMRMVQIK